MAYRDGVYQAPEAQPSLERAPLTSPPRTTALRLPLAKRLAAMHGIDLGTVKGTGPRGRISKADVLALVVQPVAATGFSRRTLRCRRKPARDRADGQDPQGRRAPAH